VLALARTDGRILHVAEGEVEGIVAPEPRGSNGFGYDPMLFYPPLGRTFAEMSQDEKAEVSHRGRASRLMHDWIGAHVDELR
jgi:XTP/dITP diphosphohydrolase